MIRAIQLKDFGTDQSPIMSGQSSKIHTRWNSATKVKITAQEIKTLVGEFERLEPELFKLRRRIEARHDE